MMMTTTLLMAATLLGNVQDPSEVLQSHRRFMLGHYDVSEHRKSWPDDRWRMCCCFFDFDGDGVDEIIATDVSRMDRSGDAWYVWTTGDDDRLFMLKGEPNFVWNCHADSFFVHKKHSGRDELVGLGLYAGFLDERRIDVLTNMPDCKIEKEGKTEERLKELKPSFDDVFRDSDVAAVERLYPEWYFGYDFRPPPDDPVNHPYLRRLPYRPPRGDLRPGGGVGEPEGFRAFAAEYRKSARASTVLAVFLDADNDGDADCYVSSDAEAVGDGAFHWTLFMNEGGRLSAAKGAVHPVKGRPELCALPPSVTVAPDGFCRVVRYDVDPTFIILDEKAGPRAVREATGCYSFHSIEKLPCREFSTQTQR